MDGKSHIISRQEAYLNLMMPHLHRECAKQWVRKPFEETSAVYSASHEVSGSYREWYGRDLCLRTPHEWPVSGDVSGSLLGRTSVSQ